MAPAPGRKSEPEPPTIWTLTKSKKDESSKEKHEGRDQMALAQGP